MASLLGPMVLKVDKNKAAAIPSCNKPGMVAAY